MNIEFKKLFKKVIIYIVSLIFLYPVLVIIWAEVAPLRLKKNISFQKFASGHASSRLEEAENIRNVDILFLGSSRSYRHYDVRIFKHRGYEAFNLGTSSQTMLQTEHLVNEFYDRMNPKIVIFDIYPLMFSADGVESTLDIISNQKVNWNALDLALNHQNIKVWNTLIFAYYYDLFRNYEKEEWFKDEQKDTYISGGFVEREIRFTKEIGTSSEKIIFRDSQIQSFKNIIQKIKSSGAKLILVQSPMHRGINYENFELIQELFTKSNLDLNNYKAMDELEDAEHFYDPYHLNQKGVEIFNQILIDDMQMNKLN